jgi:hypothetical protein
VVTHTPRSKTCLERLGLSHAAQKISISLPALVEQIAQDRFNWGAIPGKTLASEQLIT